MAHAQKLNFVFQRNGRVHLYRRGCQFSRLLAAEVCGSAVVMLHRPCPIQCTTAGYPLHSPFSPSLLHACVSVCHQIPFLLYLRLRHICFLSLKFVPVLRNCDTVVKTSNLYGVFTLWRWNHYVPPQRLYPSVCLLRGFGIPEDHKRNVVTYLVSQPPAKRLRKRVVELCVEMDIFISKSRSLRKESDKRGLEQLAYRLGAGLVPNWPATCSRLVTWSNLFSSLGNVNFSCEYDVALLVFLLFFVIWIMIYYLY